MIIRYFDIKQFLEEYLPQIKDVFVSTPFGAEQCKIKINGPDFKANLRRFAKFDGQWHNDACIVFDEIGVNALGDRGIVFIAAGTEVQCDYAASKYCETAETE